MPPEQASAQLAQPVSPLPPMGAMPPIGVAPPTSNYKPASPVITEGEIARARSVVESVGGLYRTRVVGQEGLFLSILVALFGNGHILLESVPGLAKTTAAQTLADAIKATFHRIQCTPDLLPSDIIGTQIYSYSKSTFETQLGPVHANFVLLDEINRSSAKTQSAMLEAMQERQTTIGGVVHKLPHPFVVLATQNPIEQEGTYELPEAQMDRFMLKEVVVYPSAQDEIEMLNRIEAGVFEHHIEEGQAISLEDVVMVQDLVKKVYVDKSIKQYIVSLVAATRNPGAIISPDLAKYVEYGASPRASIVFMQVGRVLALLNGRDYVTPDDVKLLRYSILRHRIILNFEAIADDVHQEAIIDAIFAAILTP